VDQVVSARSYALALSLTVLSLSGCGKAHGGSSGTAPSRATSTAAAAAAPRQCPAAKTKLPVKAVKLEWQEEDRPSSLELRPNGEIVRSGRVVGRVVGGCLLDAQGELVRSVDDEGAVVDQAGKRIGKFQSLTGGKPVRPWGNTEALVFQDGAVSAIADDGTVYYARPGEDAVSMPAGVTGKVAEARRTVLLLLDVRDELRSRR
jgi:hypothetical protein